MDNFPPEEIAYQTAHISEDRSVLVIAVSLVFLGVVILSLILRITARRVGNSKLALDDYLSIGATVALIGVTISACYGTFSAARTLCLYINKDQATLAMSVCYPWSIALAKLSVLSLFARIFTMSNRTIQIGVYFFTVYTILWWISLIFLVFFQCRPFSSNWGIPSQCHVSFATSVSTGVLNAISDIGILALPQPAIWKLQLSLSKKLALSLVFLTGGL
ncbi:uncharacterized protein BDR25DRAFT_385439 [Lindgomyces ingoldianus]|uniref:Uncharacterized protein n=1 Tax=Lindgomyces ingoldianus TaxID=673940 RepID=A0ACB6Q9R1_9PLEO|nr:uncharacterized protein BDR25DRAFT_385439 [Lindgomyces ingoldianus]KAF2462875.1 hypothetical protein BDR25DRAFT_385439 [Lindgomyces ingoldianus]